jgi:hypothetical protein
MENEKDDIPANFVLRLEENRKVRDIGGGEVTEFAGVADEGRGARNCAPLPGSAERSQAARCD